jgi:very-short-patch-repair endonuclease
MSRPAPRPALRGERADPRRDGRVVAVADLLWRSLRAIVEIDSREFHFGESQWKATMRRHNRLTRLGYTVAHYPPSDIRTRRGKWADEVAAWLAGRADELGQTA